MVIEFLGCSVEAYETGFRTLDALYQWLGACRLLSADALKIKRNNAHERNREQKRTVYSRFFHEWLPAHMDMTTTEGDAERNRKVSELRMKYLHDALEFFSKHSEYEAKHAALRLAIDNGCAGDLIKALIAAHSGKADKSLNEIVRAFRRHVVFDEAGKPGVTPKPHLDADSELHKFLNNDRTALEDVETTSSWVRENWEELKGLERLRGKVGNVPIS